MAAEDRVICLMVERRAKKSPKFFQTSFTPFIPCHPSEFIFSSGVKVDICIELSNHGRIIILGKDHEREKSQFLPNPFSFTKILEILVDFVHINVLLLHIDSFMLQDDLIHDS